MGFATRNAEWFFEEEKLRKGSRNVINTQFGVLLYSSILNSFSYSKQKVLFTGKAVAF